MMNRDYKTPAGAPPDWRGLCEELAGWIERSTRHYIRDPEVLIRARVALVEEPEPAPPAEGEVADEARYLARELRDQADDLSPSLELFGLMHHAADLLEQRHPAPVPVNERLPGPGDCDAEGRCWFWRTDGADEFWELVVPLSNIHEFNLTAQWKYTHWLPATALPLPSVEVE